MEKEQSGCLEGEWPDPGIFGAGLVGFPWIALKMQRDLRRLSNPSCLHTWRFCNAMMLCVFHSASFPFNHGACCLDHSAHPTVT